MVVAPSGEVVASLPLYVEDVLTFDVTLLGGETFYARHGDWPLLAACALLMAMATAVGRRAAPA
jgi:apolipoprotein N-acyltransferase